MRNRKLVMRREADENEVGGIGKPQKFIDLHRASQDEGKQANSWRRQTKKLATLKLSNFIKKDIFIINSKSFFIW